MIRPDELPRKPHAETKQQTSLIHKFPVPMKTRTIFLEFLDRKTLS